MPSGHSINISTGISVCRNASSMSHISFTQISSSWYKGISIRILVDISVATVKNDSV